MRENGNEVERLKKSVHIILAMAVGIMIGAVGTALAAGEVVMATFQQLALVVNGQTVDMDEEALVYEGKTYMPVRALLHALGYDVKDEADTRTISAVKSLEALQDEIEKLSAAKESEHRAIADLDERIRVTEKMLNAATGELETAKAKGHAAVVGELEKQIKAYGEKLDELRQQKAAMVE
jgi:hypothetical protein